MKEVLEHLNNILLRSIYWKAVGDASTEQKNKYGMHNVDICQQLEF